MYLLTASPINLRSPGLAARCLRGKNGRIQSKDCWFWQLRSSLDLGVKIGGEKYGRASSCVENHRISSFHDLHGDFPSPIASSFSSSSSWLQDCSLPGSHSSANPSCPSYEFPLLLIFSSETPSSLSPDFKIAATVSPELVFYSWLSSGEITS